MKQHHLYLTFSASALLLAACGGGGTDEGANQAPEAAVEAAVESTPDTALEAAPPTADDVTSIDGTKLSDFTADPAAGRSVFLQCKSCHVMEEGRNRVGPSLAGIIGREAGTVEGFKYSEANATSGIVWTPEKMYQFLENPRRVIPGTRMAYGGLRDGQKRADLIGYLEAP